jgi:hypothetical protein
VTVPHVRPPGRKPIYVKFRVADFQRGTKPAAGMCSYPACGKRPKWARLGGTGNLAYCTGHAKAAGWPVPARQNDSIIPTPEHGGTKPAAAPRPDRLRPWRWIRIGGRS